MKSMFFQNILHIDDDADNHEMFYDVLQDVNGASKYYPLTDARDALDQLIEKKLTPDVIFLDLNMPKMNGQEFLIEIKRCEELCNIPIIVLSTTSHPATVALTKSLGAKSFITKPLSYGEFVQVLSSVLLTNSR